MIAPLSRRPRRGFTFIEILTVFVLFACVTGAARIAVSFFIPPLHPAHRVDDVDDEVRMAAAH